VIKITNFKSESWARKWRFKPAIMFKTNPCGNFTFYSKVGVVFPVGGATWTQIRQNNVNTGQETVAKVKTLGNATVGLMGALGLAYHIGNGFMILAEVESLWYDIVRESSQITQYKVNGVDLKGTLSEAQRVIKYKDAINFASDNTPGNIVDPNQPTKELKVKTPFNSLGFKAGIMKVF